MKPVAIMRRSAGNAAQINAILGLPNDAWTDLEVTFGMDSIAQARVSLLLSQDQVVALADVLSDTGNESA